MPKELVQKIVRIDLTNWKEKIETTEKYSKFISGMGIGEIILYEEVEPWMSPYDPGNKIIISSGPLSGTAFPGTGRTAMVTKSPMTMGMVSSNSGGNFSAKLRFAGFEHIVFEGKSPKPVYIYIKNGKIEFYNASEIVGKTVWETDDFFRGKFGDNVQTLIIGPAGENMVRYASVMVDKHRAFGRCGVGAVMGSKNLKGVVVDGTGPVEIYDEKLFFELLDDMHNRLDRLPSMEKFIKDGTMANVTGKAQFGGYVYKHFQDLSIPKNIEDNFQPGVIAEKYRVCQSTCYGCIIGCQPRYRITEGPYAGLTMEGTQFNSSLDFGTKLDIDNFGFCIKATALCNDFGMDIDCVAETIGWLMECCEKGIITSDELDGLFPTFGDEETSLKLIRKMAYRDGIGSILSEGVARAATQFDEETKYYAMHIKGNDLYEPLRSLIGYGLGSVTSTRGGSHVLGSPLCESWSIENHELAKEKFGINTYDKPLEYQGKPEMVKYYEIITRISSVMGICLFASDWQDMDMLGIADFIKLLKATTGIDISEEEIIRRMLALLAIEKVFNYTHAGFDRNDDYPPKRLMEEKVPTGFAKGSVLDKERWDKLLDKYYEIHGWNKDTGLPSKETLEELGLGFCIEEVEKKAKAPGHAFL
ncbi:aldehyde:ferredoxin oxidoreductase [Dethiosulfatibacter aminovorans DSM 17477]|uniref:Aldehyde:ferredoxin oxidoreductase n=1 Tax=Dethiosulfatibacter aminovorans DSM 17477 TaxID=1121476 RepID=A0A1M6M0B1_9FIRM|nr:aldehyde ferredoxin oxidoreductase family protein [Dethiosulfatibacter aminovorans]SHJ76844.1 aldehyde:ferredoxin oxidoreductase [Dethiosulfatibacter aminovorans DSM 17477]